VGFATIGSAPLEPLTGVSPRSTGSRASEYWIFCRSPLMSRQSYLPLPIVRAFGHRFRLGLSVAPPFGFGVPHQPCRRHGLLCRLLTPALRSGHLVVASVPRSEHDAGLPR